MSAENTEDKGGLRAPEPVGSKPWVAPLLTIVDLDQEDTGTTTSSGGDGSPVSTLPS